MAQTSARHRFLTLGAPSPARAGRSGGAVLAQQLSRESRIVDLGLKEGSQTLLSPQCLLVHEPSGVAAPRTLTPRYGVRGSVKRH